MESLRVIAAVFALIIVVAPVLWEVLECDNDNPIDWPSFFIGFLAVGFMGIGAMMMTAMSLWSLVFIVPVAFLFWKQVRRFRG